MDEIFRPIHSSTSFISYHHHQRGIIIPIPFDFSVIHNCKQHQFNVPTSSSLPVDGCSKMSTATRANADATEWFIEQSVPSGWTAYVCVCMDPLGGHGSTFALSTSCHNFLQPFVHMGL
uniref:Uncharacterized protein n=1 Tax=Anopheles coluzzii TaxID=1518534 RepID=A0A8W7Q2T4_ANOCL